MVEKIMVSLPQKFEAKIFAIEESCDLQHLTIAELISKLHIQEQRVQMRDDDAMEGAFQANNRGKKNGGLPFKKFNNGKQILSKFKPAAPANKQIFLPCSYCKRTNHAEVNCWFKGKTVIHCDLCKKGGHSEKFCRLKKKPPQHEIQQHAHVTEEDKADEEHLFMVTCDEQNSRRDTWLIDSGCTSHMTKFLSIFSTIDRSIKPKIKLGNGDVVEAKGRGTINVKTSRGTKTITNVLYIPELDQNLLSVAQMLRNGYEVSFTGNFCYIADSHDLAIAKIKMEGNSFYLNLNAIEGHALSAKVDESIVWHKRFGHYNFNSLVLLHNNELVDGMPEICGSNQICENCEIGKQHRRPFP